MYGFHKVNRVQRGTRHEANEYEFSHENFSRGRIDLIDSVKRKSFDRSSFSEKEAEAVVPFPLNQELQACISELQQQISEITKELMRQRNDNAVLKSTVNSILSWMKEQGLLYSI